VNDRLHMTNSNLTLVARVLLTALVAGLFVTSCSSTQKSNDQIVASLRKHDSAAFVTLLKEPHDLNTPSSDGSFPLVVAIEWGDIHVVQSMLEAGADANLRLGDGISPFSLSIQYKRPEVSKMLIDHGVDCVSGGSIGLTPLHLAATYGDAPLVQKLVTCGAKVGARDANGWTPLHTAAANSDDADIVKALLSAGSDINAVGGGVTPIVLSVAGKHQNVTKLLIASGADLTFRTSNGASILQVAEATHDAEMIGLVANALAVR
jgi:uncharacterized protein